MIFALSEANETALVVGLLPSVILILGAIAAWIKSRADLRTMLADNNKTRADLAENTRATLATKHAAAETARTVNGQRAAMVQEIDDLKKTIAKLLEKQP